MALPQDLGKVHAIALPAAHGAHKLVLRRALQVEGCRVRPDVDLLVADLSGEK